MIPPSIEGYNHCLNLKPWTSKSLYLPDLESGKFFVMTPVIKRLIKSSEYKGSKSGNDSVNMESTMLNPINKIRMVATIVIFTLFKKELNKVTNPLTANIYNTAIPND